MKETKRKQKHPNWVVRVRQGQRDATATQQTTQRCPKRQKNTKMRKAEKNATGGKRRQTYIYIHTYKHTAHSKTHKLSTQHILNFHIHSFASWIPGCSTCKSRSRNARTTEKRQDRNVSFSEKSTGHTKIRRHSRPTKSESSNELICLFSHEPGTTWTSSPAHIAYCGVCRGVFCAACPPDAAGNHDAPSHGYPLAHPLLYHVVFGAAPRRVLSLTPLLQSP